MADFTKLNFINIGPNGPFRASGQLQTLPEDVDEIIDHIEKMRQRKVVLHFHGGLVNEKMGIETAKKMHHVYEVTGSHSIAFVWETGLLETIHSNLSTIGSSAFFKKICHHIISLTAQFFFDQTGKGPVGRLAPEEVDNERLQDQPFVYYDESFQQLSAFPDTNALDQHISEIEVELEAELEADLELDTILSEEVPDLPLLNQDFIKDIREDQSKGFPYWIKLARHLAQIIIRTIRRHYTKTDHGFYPTLVEEIIREFYVADLGKWVWSGMKDAASAMWLPHDSFPQNELRAGTYFLDQLASLQVHHPKLTIDLVGHSAGSIAICHLLRSASKRYPALRFRNVLFLAPACSTDLFRQAVVHHPEQFERFRMFTMEDHLECKDILVPMMYTRSLLYLVSGVLEDEVDQPLVGMERYLSGEVPYNDTALLEVRNYLLENFPERLILATTDSLALPGQQSTAVTHGGFDDDHSTLESLQFILQGG